MANVQLRQVMWLQVHTSQQKVVSSRLTTDHHKEYYKLESLMPKTKLYNINTSTVTKVITTQKKFVLINHNSFYRAACNATHGTAVAILSVRCVYCDKSLLQSFFVWKLPAAKL